MIEGTARRCDQCEAKRPAPVYGQPDDQRGNSTQRGYDRQWRNLRLTVLKRDPICRKCHRERSTVADHIIPKRKGGRDVLGNLQGLCAPCHNRKTRQGL